MLRTYILLLCAAMAFGVPALAQTASLGERTVADGLVLPPESAATVDGAASGTLNPAGLGLMQGLQLEYWHEREILNAGGVTGDGLYGAATLFDFLAAGLAVEWVRPDLGGDLTKTHFQLALAPDRAFSIGLGYNILGYADPLFGMRGSWDAGLSWRPWKFISLAASARDFDNPTVSATGERAARRFDFALGIRPVGPNLTVAADYLFLTDGSAAFGQPLSGAGNGRVGLTVQLALPFGIGVFAGAGVPVGAYQTAYGQAGLQIAIEHAAATVAYAPSDNGSPFSPGALDVGLRLSKESFKGLPRPGVEAVEVDVAELLAPKQPGLMDLFSSGEGEDPYETLLRSIANLSESRAGAVIFYLSEVGGLSLGKIEELRDAIGVLRAHGKMVVAYLSGGSDAIYYLASACERIYAVPQTDFPLHGFAASSLYFAEGLGKLGVKVDVVRVGPYKSAPDALTRNEPSPEQLEVTRALLNDASERYMAAVTKGRGVSAETFRAVLDRGLSTADDLFKAGLVDAVLYPDEVSRAIGRVLQKPVFTEALEVDKDLHQAAWSNLPGIALVNVFGTITGGESESGPLGLEQTAGAETIVRQLRAAAKDYGVEAVVVRVDSGGGDGAASELIWREIGQVRRRKPVIVSFGDVAASGGYYLALSADEILAEPSTITGSIGAFAIKPDLSGLAQKLGIHPHQESLTPNADLFSLSTPWSDGERAVVQAYIDSFYATFVKRVAEGRALSEAKVEAVGRGHVWSGSQAKERGLVDGFGSLLDAIDHAKGKVGIGKNQEVRIVTYGEKKKSLLNLGALVKSSEGGQVMGVVREVLKETGATSALLLRNSSAVAMPEEMPQVR